MSSIKGTVSVVIPAKNEGASIARLVRGLHELKMIEEVIVVDDGSNDETVTEANRAGARVISHPYSKGNGAAVKTGATAAQGSIIVFMDGDGQHAASDVPVLLEKLNSGFDMVVAARPRKAQASLGRLAANATYNRFASWMVGHEVKDLTSGFRAVSRSKFLEFVSLLPNGFSYPTTSTMAFFRAGYSVGYVSIAVARREGKSHIKPLKDGVKFLLIIFKVGTLYSPLKIFVPVSLAFVGLGLLRYFYTFLILREFTNMSALLISMGVLTFLVGLVSEQITNLTYQAGGKDKDV